jgi:putative FmdB family regulatory protein
MPIYEYRCAACGHEIEALRRLSDAPLTMCPSCQKPELKKLLSAAGFQLKGSGWYATDFRNSGAKPAAKEKSETKSTASGDNGGTTAAGSSESATGAETKSADKPATSTTPESKPAATTTSTPKSDS